MPGIEGALPRAGLRTDGTLLTPGLSPSASCIVLSNSSSMGEVGLVLSLSFRPSPFLAGLNADGPGEMLGVLSLGLTTSIDSTAAQETGRNGGDLSGEGPVGLLRERAAGTKDGSILLLFFPSPIRSEGSRCIDIRRGSRAMDDRLVFSIFSVASVEPFAGENAWYLLLGPSGCLSTGGDSNGGGGEGSCCFCRCCCCC